jgi:hypothetical protein
MTIYNIVANQVPIISRQYLFDTPGSGTFVVPFFRLITVEIWGGGGSGGEAYNGNTISQGGQGGSYKRYLITAGQLTPGSILNYLVGAGGAAVQSNGGAGLAGGFTTFADAVWAKGGYGGRGQFVGATAALDYTPTNTVSWTLNYSETGGEGGYGAVGSNATYAGGGGGGGQNTGGVQKAGGTSTYGGNGGLGNGGWASMGGSPNGISPAGGGGGLVYTNFTGKGGDGRIVVTVNY